MRTHLLVILLAVSSLSACHSSEKKKTLLPETEAPEMTTYFLIRHAEKDRSDPENSDPELTEAGLERAKKWATFFIKIPLDQIYSTSYKRTQQTVMDLAADHAITVQTYDASSLYSQDFQRLTKAKTVLVAGHSNTTPQFVNAILGTHEFTDMDDTDNSSLYMVTVVGDQKKAWVFTVE
ncbi:phosphoglycerate mutase family protein [Altibacter sp.]|uniref:SixA phosphatase family protein n=1 Tax=Altibacter sp. TaxID=2024823 RepID=UPI000C89D219|nr:phosphoglycerate mutase family protein [Altibacter sp.]MAP54067.1 phosphoglycerate mutase [Altibacter sp.]